jgi:hypothetical protein
MSLISKELTNILNLNRYWTITKNTRSIEGTQNERKKKHNAKSPPPHGEVNSILGRIFQLVWFEINNKNDRALG